MDRQTLAQEITQYLTEQGAARVGFAELHGVTGHRCPTASRRWWRCPVRS